MRSSAPIREADNADCANFLEGGGPNSGVVHLKGVVTATISPGQRSSVELLDAFVQSSAGVQVQRRLQHLYGARVSRDDIEDAYQGAYEALRQSCSLRGTTKPEIARCFAVAAERRLLMMLRRRRYEVASGDGNLLDQADPSSDDRAIDVDLTPMVGEIADKLNERQRDVLALYCLDLTRSEIAQRLQISEKRAKKDLEAILATGRQLLAGKAGRGCLEGQRMVTAFAFGLLRRPRELATAQAHLAGCTQCGALYERLEMFRDAAAALMPIPGAGAAGHAGMLEKTTHKLADAVSAARHHIADGTSHTKVQAANAYTRIADPTPLAGSRPGAVGAVLASCLAVGSGATYCAQQGFDPIRGLAGVATPKSHTAPEPKRKPRAKATADTSPPPPVIPTPAPAPAPAPPAATTPVAPTPAPAAPPMPPPPAPNQGGGSTREFDPGAAASPAQAAPTPQPSQPSTPAPATHGEFAGP